MITLWPNQVFKKRVGTVRKPRGQFFGMLSIQKSARGLWEASQKTVLLSKSNFQNFRSSIYPATPPAFLHIHISQEKKLLLIFVYT